MHPFTFHSVLDDQAAFVSVKIFIIIAASILFSPMWFGNGVAAALIP